MLTVLSLFDERSRPKGTRDPLGAEVIWSFIGRKLVGNLTTVTSNLDNFIVSLLCCRYACDQSDNPRDMQEHFLRFEQLAAYLRCQSGRDSLLGISRTRNNLGKSELKALPLGRGSESEILSNQLSYGLWGLYSTALQLADLLEPGQRKPNATGQEFIDSLVSVMGGAEWTALVGICQRKKVTRVEIERHAPAFADLLRNQSLRKRLVGLLLDGRLASRLQRELFLLAHIYLAEVSEWEVAGFCGWLQQRSDITDELRRIVLAIQSIEPLLVLAVTITGWLQGQQGCERSKLVEVLAPRLAKLGLRDDWMQLAELPHRNFLMQLHQYVIAGDALQVINTLLEHNSSIMAGRKGAPWLEWEGQRLKVRVRNDRALLPEQLDESSLGWQNSYFIGSFLAIAAEVV